MCLPYLFAAIRHGGGHFKNEAKVMEMGSVKSFAQIGLQAVA